MTLRQKTIAVLLLSFAGYVALALVIERSTFAPSFAELEQRETERSLQRVIGALEREVEYLGLLTQDWAWWSDTYDVAATHDPAIRQEYEESNLTPETFEAAGLNLIYILDADRRVLAGSAESPDDDPITFEAFSEEVWPEGPVLAPVEEVGGRSGVLLTEHGPLLIASRSILQSDHSGPPVGYVIMGRLLGSDTVDGLVEQTAVDFAVVDALGANDDERARIDAIQRSGTERFEATSRRVMAAEDLIVGLDGEPALLVRVEIPRDISRRGESALRISHIAIFIAAVFVFGILVFLVEKTVLSRVKELSEGVRQIGAHQDPSERVAVQGEDELAELGMSINRMLADLQEKNQRLDAVAEDAKRSAEARSRFVASMSHEIRTPLNGIIGMANLLDEDDFDEAQRMAIHTIRESSDALLRIINDILDFSKIDAGRFDLADEPFQIARVVDGVADLLAAAADAKEIDLVTHVEEDVPRWVSGDAGAVRQVLINLVGNALKFTDDGGIEVRVRSGDADIVHIEVEDSGPGIPKGERESLFGAFTTSKTHRGVEGTGLGLAIARQLCVQMGGDIDVESVVGEGATFTARLRLPPADVDADEEPPDLSAFTAIIAIQAGRTATALQRAVTARGATAIRVSKLEDVIEQADHSAGPVIALIDLQNIDNARAAAPAVKWVGVARPGQLREISGAWYTGYHGVIVRPVSDERLDTVLRRLLGDAVDPAEPPVSPPSRNDLHGIRVLLAEDNLVNRRVAVLTLERQGLVVETATDGLECVARLAEGHFDIVLMDCRMPRMDGLEATRRIRSMGSTVATIPIIALTASATSAERDACLSAGMDGFVSKPLQPDELFATIRDCIPSRDGSAEQA